MNDRTLRKEDALVMVASTSIDSGIVELVSQILEQPLSDKQVTPRVVFITALATALVGVVFADGAVSEEEKQRLQKTLKQFMPEGSSIGQLIRQLVQGIQKQKLYSQGAFVSKLIATLSESEKLLILCFSYEIAKADGEIASEEQQYIQKFSNILNLEPTHVAGIQALWNETESTSEPFILEELHGLLDPHQFQGIDPVFAKAASYICDKFPKPDKTQSTQASSITYAGLEQFQQARKQLDALCLELYNWVEECSNHFALPKNLKQELAKLSKSLQSQKFRLAVVGEFSQGKSTLLNALLGEEVQPVRAIPCSGTVTVLRYGSSRRVICKYKDGHEEEIPFELYGEKASIPEDAVLSDIGGELAKSEIEEIILEHPDLTLCRHGVEIVDSPGLNEHPERTAITQQLLQETDAAIFLANASRPLTHGERGLLLDLKQQLNHNQADQPTENLFVLVNFMDLLRREKDKEQVRQLITNFVRGSTPIVAHDNRLHFVSAQASLDALLKNESNDYLDSFQKFVLALEHFLVHECGEIKIKTAIDTIRNIIQECELALKQAENILDGQVHLSESEQKRVIDHIGEASGRGTRICQEADNVLDDVIDNIIDAWKDWTNDIESKIANKSAYWNSNSGDKKKILSDYSEQFIRDLSEELDVWMDQQVRHKVLQPRLKLLDDFIIRELNSIRHEMEEIDEQSGSSLSKQFTVSISKLGISLRFDSLLNADELGFNMSKILGVGSGAGGFLGIVALSFLGFGFLPIMLAGGVTGLVSSWFLNSGEAEQKMKQQVFDKGFEKFADSTEQIFDKICGKIAEEVYARAETGSAAIRNSITILDALLNQAEKSYQDAGIHKANIIKQQEKLLLLERNISLLMAKFLA